MLKLLKFLLMFVTFSMMVSAKQGHDANEPDKMILSIGYAICFVIMWAHI